MIVKPGEQIPLDGTIIAGDSSIDESLLTGESLPVDKTIGSKVYAGTLNQSGALEIKVTNNKSLEDQSKLSAKNLDKVGSNSLFSMIFLAKRLIIRIAYSPTKRIIKAEISFGEYSIKAPMNWSTYSPNEWK